MGDYSPSTFKRAKPDHTTLRTLTTYGVASAHPHYHQQYGQTPSTDLMHAYFQQYSTNTSGSAKGTWSNAQQSYWSDANEAAAMWQQHYR